MNINIIYCKRLQKKFKINRSYDQKIDHLKEI